MPVQMERMRTRVKVINHNLHHLILLQHKGVRVSTIHGRVLRRITSREGAIQRGHLGTRVSDVVEEGVVLAVAEVVHDDVEFDDAVGLREERHLVVGDESHVVKGGEFVDDGWGWVGCGVVVGKPAGDVVVEVFGEGVKEVLKWWVVVVRVSKDEHHIMG